MKYYLRKLKYYRRKIGGTWYRVRPVQAMEHTYWVTLAELKHNEVIYETEWYK